MNFLEVEYLRDLSRFFLLIGKLKNEFYDAMWNFRRWHECYPHSNQTEKRTKSAVSRPRAYMEERTTRDCI